MDDKIKRYAMWGLKILFILFIILYFEWWGVGGIILFYIVSGLYGVWVNRQYVINLKHYIESAIWGKPLHMFGKGEKYPKVKVVWRKKNDKSKNK